MKQTLTDEHIKDFISSVEQWQTKLNLQDWRIEYSSSKASKNAMAEVHIDSESKLANYRIGKNWGNIEPTPENIKLTALHEMLHIMLRPLIDAVGSRDEKLVLQVEHSIITILEKVIAK